MDTLLSRYLEYFRIYFFFGGGLPLVTLYEEHFTIYLHKCSSFSHTALACPQDSCLGLGIVQWMDDGAIY